MLLYRPEVEVGSRGDIIQLYNKVFIGFIKDFVTRFFPSDDVNWKVALETSYPSQHLPSSPLFLTSFDSFLFPYR